MEISSAQWTNVDRNTIEAVIDGEVMWVPTDPMNRHYAEIIRRGMAIASPDQESEV